MSQLVRLASLGSASSPPSPAPYVDDVFSMSVYTGTGASLSVPTGIDLTVGGMSWIKNINGGLPSSIYDTVRGVQNEIVSDSAAAQVNQTTGLTAFGSSTITVGAYANVNTNTSLYEAWNFQKAAKFFDVVQFTIPGVNTNQRISHGLGVAPGMIILKPSNATGHWFVYHSGMGQDLYALSDLNGAPTSQVGAWGTSPPTSSDFGINTVMTGTGNTWIAYIFAHDPTGIIQCGSYTGNGAAGLAVSLGWEPQYILVKDTTTTGNWVVIDNAREIGLTVQGLYSMNNSSITTGNNLNFTATGFTLTSNASGTNNNGDTYIYMAIRRSNKPPTLGTQVYNAIARTANAAATTVSGVGFRPDVVIAKGRSTGKSSVVFDKQRGALRRWGMDTAAAEITTDTVSLVSFVVPDGFRVSTDSGAVINAANGVTFINWCLQRRVGVFDQVLFAAGTAANRRVPHGLGVVPEMIIMSDLTTAKNRFVYTQSVGQSAYQTTNQTAIPVASNNAWGTSAPTVSDFGINEPTFFTAADNVSALLFATKAGVSKVGTYTGNGITLTVNCGFSTGARFVLIKRTDSIGDWFVWDTARGIGTGTDPHLSLNTQVAEVTTDSSIDPASSGFTAVQNAVTNINSSALVPIWASNTMAGGNDSVFIAASPTIFITIPITNPSNSATSSLNGTTWSANTLPASKQWVSATYGNGVFVAVAGGGVANTQSGARSVNGTTWTGNTIGIQLSNPTVAYGNGIFLIVSGSGTTDIVTSPDGTTWTPGTASIGLTTSNNVCLVYGAGIWVLLPGGSTTYYTSTDNINWTSRTFPSGSALRTIVFAAGKFVVLDNGSNISLYSTDGINWTASTLPASDSWYSIAYGNGYFLAACNNSTTGAISSDGITWFAKNLPSTLGYRTMAFASAIGAWAVSSGNTNGAVASMGWTARTQAFAGNIIDATNSSFVTLSNGSSTTAQYSADGTTWASKTLPGAARTWVQLASNGSTIVAMAQSSAAGAYSTDGGLTWTANNIGLNSSTPVMAYGNGIFLALNGAGTTGISTSSDGIAWTTSNANIVLSGPGQTHSLCFGNGIWVLMTGSNLITSPDGVNWTNRGTFGSTVFGVTFGNGMFVAVEKGASSSSNAYYSTDGINWNTATLPATAAWYAVGYGGGYFVATADSSISSAYSTDGINWFSLLQPASRNWRSVAYNPTNNTFATASFNTAGASIQIAAMYEYLAFA